MRIRYTVGRVFVALLLSLALASVGAVYGSDGVEALVASLDASPAPQKGADEICHPGLRVCVGGPGFCDEARCSGGNPSAAPSGRK